MAEEFTKLSAGAVPWRVTAEEALALPEFEGQRSAAVLAHGTMVGKIYAPEGEDPQTPHAQDEIYAVIRGSGWFVNGGNRHPFGPGDMLFAPAGVEHRFEDFTDDFATWVVFYGPQGGEAPR